MKKLILHFALIMIALSLISMFVFSSCRKPEVIIKTIVETSVETVVETVIETVIETVEVEKIIEKPAGEEILEEPGEEAGPVPKEEIESIIFNGSGDSIIDINKSDLPMVVHITGNSSSGYFGVTSYDKEGEYLDLLVNTTEPYDGIRPLDFSPDEWTARFEIVTADAWTIEILPLFSIKVFTIPGKIEGKDDEVLKLSGGIPDLAIISGNDSGSYFGIFTHNDFKDLIVNETEPYEGTVLLDSEAIFIEVIAVGDWSIEITTK